MLCKRCGHPNGADTRYCTECGAEASSPSKTEVHTSLLKGAVPDPMVTSRTIEPGKAILVVQEGWETSLRFEIVNPVSRCGRSPNSDLLLDDVTVSRKHAEIIRDDSEFWLVDQGSINGTYLNGRRVLRGRLKSGDKLQIGKFRLVFMVGAD